MSDADFEITANGSKFSQACHQALKEGGKMAEGIEKKFNAMGGVLEGIQKKFMLLAAVIGGGAMLKEAVQHSAEFTDQSMKLGVALGINATQAGILKATLDDAKVSQDEFSGAAQKLANNVRTNEEQLNKMGLKTRDAAGHLRNLDTITLEALEVLRGYKEGTDRAMAAQVLFGKGFQLTSGMMQLNTQAVQENAEWQTALGNIITQENINAFQAYKAATDMSSSAMDAMKKTVGDAVMPVLTDLSVWFNDVAPAAVVVLRGAIGGLVSVFHGLKFVVQSLWEMMKLAVKNMIEMWSGLGEVLSAVFKGDFAGAIEASKRTMGALQSNASAALNTISADAEKTRDALWNLFARPEGNTAAPSGAGKSATGLVEKKEGKTKAEPKDKSQLQFFELMLAEEKRYQSERDILRDYSKAQELMFWQNVLTSQKMTSKDRVAVEKKVSELTVQIRRTAANNVLQLEGELNRSEEQLALARLDRERQDAQTRLDLKQITQMQFLQQEEVFEQKRYEIQMIALQERLLLAEKDPSTNPIEYARIKNEILLLEQQHQNAIAKIKGDQAKEKNKGGMFGQMFEGFGESLSGAMQGLLTKTQTWAQSLKNIYSGIRDMFIKTLVTEPLQQWIAGLGQMLMAKLGFTTADTAATATAAGTNAGIKATEATAVGTANAVEAATGAASSVASTPYVGPALAAAAFAGIMALTMGSLSSIKSASGGYDIPKGVNPLTQLHEEEMVLPKSIAAPLRDALSSGGVAGGAESDGAVNFHVNAMDSRDVKRFLMGHKGTVADALKSAYRDGKR